MTIFRSYPLTGRRSVTNVSLFLMGLTAATSIPGAVLAQTLATPSPATTTPIPGVTPTTVATGIPTQVLTLDDVIARTLNRNSTVQLSEIRVKKAQEAITQTLAGAYPQVRIDVADTLSSQKSFNASVGGTSNSVTLPGIPVVVDQGGGTNGTFIGGGGGGTTETGGGSVSVGGTAPAGTINGTNNGTTTTTSPGTTTTTPGGSSTTPGATGTGTTGVSGVSAHALPMEVATFADSFQNTMAAADEHATASRALKAHDTTTGTGTTGTGTGTTIINNSGGQYNNYGARLSVTQSIDIFNLVPTSKSVLEITRDFYVTDLERVKNEIALSTKSAFFNILQAQASVATQQEQVTAAQESLRIAQARFNAGVAAQFDVLTAQTTLTNAQQQLSSAQNQLNLALANLNSILGQSLDTPISLQAPALPPANFTIDLPQAVQTAFTKRPEIVQANNNITIAKRLIKLSRAGLLPSLSLSAAANYAGTTTQGNSRDTYSITADLGIPLYDGGATKARVRSAEDDLATQEITLGQLRENVTLEVRQAYLNILNAQQQSVAANQGVTQAEESLRLANIRYQNERGTLLEISNAQAQLATARNNLATAQFNYQTSLAQLTRAEGGR